MRLGTSPVIHADDRGQIRQIAGYERDDAGRGERHEPGQNSYEHREEEVTRRGDCGDTVHEARHPFVPTGLITLDNDPVPRP
ncbi:hypothetical protein GCM10027535_49900 [Mycolicibacterium hippocampi]|uniref:Uncharacterized protein n=1 Tax=Mycolicibacterium poriferae TaxID=39694 RepID=A0A6N4VIV5_9MYCO|nr:hypothetical protein MPOR_55670 [Mycolicibacterium poriferae]